MSESHSFHAYSLKIPIKYVYLLSPTFHVSSKASTCSLGSTSLGVLDPFCVHTWTVTSAQEFTRSPYTKSEPPWMTLRYSIVKAYSTTKVSSTILHSPEGSKEPTDCRILRVITTLPGLLLIPVLPPTPSLVSSRSNSLVPHESLKVCLGEFKHITWFHLKFMTLPVSGSVSWCLSIWNEETGFSSLSSGLPGPSTEEAVSALPTSP